MRQMTIDGIDVTAPEDIAYDELKAYVDHAKKAYNALKSMTVELDGEYANLTVHTVKQPFERIRRITGYLVGTMPRWNDAKRAEERDRVKHGIEV